MEQTNTINAGFFIRFLAHMLNMFINLFVYTLPFLIATFILDKPTFDNLNSYSTVFAIGLSLFLVSGILYTLYNIYFVSSFGGDLGKILFGLKIVNAETNNLIDKKTAFYRLFPGYMFSSVLFGIGFFRIIKNPDNLAWHDELFGTKVIKTGLWVTGFLTIVLLLVYFGYFGYQILSLFSTI